jgi:hypothetical protein
MKRIEDAIQRTVFEHLRARAASGVFAFHCPNGGVRSAIEAGIFRGLERSKGFVSGLPDWGRR